MRLVYEGVEELWQYELIQQSGLYGYAQGYYFSKPVAAEKITEILLGSRILP
jgi:EAL domain-containing protein (putative c-di-GMP-specific phosphodiesterase class I)